MLIPKKNRREVYKYLFKGECPGLGDCSCCCKCCCNLLLPTGFYIVSYTCAHFERHSNHSYRCRYAGFAKQQRLTT
jgi:hypothetical protein